MLTNLGPVEDQVKGRGVGEQFQVNSYTGLWQSLARVAADSQGNFVVTWSDTDIASPPGSDTSGHSVQAQRYQADGTPMGGQFLVNSYTSGGQVTPAIAAGP